MAITNSTAQKIYTEVDRKELLNTTFELCALLDGVNSILFSVSNNNGDYGELANSANRLLAIARERMNAVIAAIDEKIPTMEAA